MAEYFAETVWSRGDQDFLDGCYSRKHVLRFDGGIEVPASSSPHIVPTPYSETAALDPEEAFVAALSSCHMLVFLGIAAKRKYVVDHYFDAAVGLMEKNHHGKLAIMRVTLRPDVQFADDKQPGERQLEKMHRLAHEGCFIASSVTTEVICRPVHVSDRGRS